MSVAGAQLRRPLDARWPRRAVETLRSASSAGPASPASEANVVALLAELMPAAGIDAVTVRDFLPGRPNVWGVRKGTGRRPDA